MAEPYLILHKVRGQPAFDIAHRIQLGDEEGWVLSACGYRAYPYQYWPMTSMWHHTTNGDFVPTLIAMPEPWPDLFACNDRPLREEAYEVKAKAAGLLQALGLVKKIERRL